MDIVQSVLLKTEEIQTRLHAFLFQLEKCLTHQFISNVVNDVRIVQPPFLILPPAFNVDAGLPFKVGQVKVVPVKTTKSSVLSCFQEVTNSTLALVLVSVAFHTVDQELD